MLFSLFVNGPSHRALRRGALHAAPARRATLNDEIFAGAAVERDEETRRARKEIVEGEESEGHEAALKYCSGPLLPRLLPSLLRSRGTMTNPRRFIVATPSGV